VMPMRDAAQTHDEGSLLPSKGDRIELFRTEMGVRVRLCGTVFYSDQVQVLVKWDDGRSQSLRPGSDRFRIVPPEGH
jgi:hypothetical protein